MQINEVKQVLENTEYLTIAFIFSNGSNTKENMMKVYVLYFVKISSIITIDI